MNRSEQPTNKAAKAPQLSGRWVVVHNADVDPDGLGSLTIEDDDGTPVAIVPFGGNHRLGYTAAEKVAREIAALPGRTQ